MSEQPAQIDSAPDATRISVAPGKTLTEAAYEALRADIIHGRRSPGERLRIERLKQDLRGWPDPAVRGAPAAQRRRAGDRTWHRGFAVVGLGIDEFKDLNIARTAVEMEALRLSVARGDDAWEAGIVSAAYRMAKEDARLGVSGCDTLDSWESANEAFHSAMVAACGSNWLLHIRRNLHDQCERYRRASVYLRRGTRDLHAEHKAIADAALARDAEKLCALTREHYDATERNLAEDFGARNTVGAQ